MSEPTDTVTAEGYHLAEAINKAAEQLGVDPMLVSHKYDLSHFRNEEGRARPVDTVKIIAWARDPKQMEGAMAAKEWMEGLLSKMSIEATLKVDVTGDNQATLSIDSPSARHLVGRQGSNLRAINDLLTAAMKKDYADWQVRIDVQGGERRERRDDDRGDRGDRRDRRDRGDRRDRRDRGERRERRDRRDGGDHRSERDVEKLKALARRLAEEAVESGEPVHIRRELNSFERRVVHMVIAELDGVESESVGDGRHKKILIRSAEA
jgi:predicted RNA-binding protein Jag